ncbi:MAG TPA: choice-of-anchor Q domain-containing protein, partial [Dokdonella sp.]
MLRDARVRCSLAVLLAAAARLPTAAASDGVVGPGGCDEAGFDAVLATVQDSGGGTITFDCGAAPTTIPITSYAAISAAVTIDGGDRITLDAGGAAAFFQVFSGARLELRHLTLRGGTFGGVNVLENFGALELSSVAILDSTSSALVNYGSTLVQSSRFADNAAPAGDAGAALRNEGGTALIADTTFSGNVVAGDTGTGGAIAANAGTLEMHRSTFTTNRAPDGGAIFVGADASARIEQSTFSGNRAGYAGAIETWSSDLGIRTSRFDGNAAESGDGGAIWSLGGSPAIEYDQFTDNTAATTGGAVSCSADVLNVSRSAFGSNRAGAAGGALYGGCGFLVTDSTFHANTAGAGAGGGAIYHTGARYAGVFFTTIADNAAGYGGGIVSESSDGTSVNLFGVLLAGNDGGNCAGVLTSGGYNVSDDSYCGGAFGGPGDLGSTPVPLQAFADHGGPTDTQPPQAGSAAIDRIPSDVCLGVGAGPLDQRGAARPAGAVCDSGAYELGGIVDEIFGDGF